MNLQQLLFCKVLLNRKVRRVGAEDAKKERLLRYLSAFFVFFAAIICSSALFYVAEAFSPHIYGNLKATATMCLIPT